MVWRMPAARQDGQMTANQTPRLELKGITKRFPGVLANDNVSFAVQPGEIHACLARTVPASRLSSR